MEERRKAKGKEQEYKKANGLIRKKCREAKEAWALEQCQEIENLERISIEKMHQRVKLLTGVRKSTDAVGLRDEKGEMLFENGEILRR